MTVRGFLAWYLTTVVLVSASGAGAWHGIQSRRHINTAAVLPPPAMETSSSSPQVANAEPMQLTESGQFEVTPPKVHPPQSNAAPLPLPPLLVPMQSHSATQTASAGATPPWIASIRPRRPRKVAASASTHRYPRTVIVQRADIYPYRGPGSYVPAYPPAPWQVSRYAYYYPPYGYFPRHGYYYYPAN